MKEGVLILFIGCFLVSVNGQIGVTGCTFTSAANCPNFLPNSYCNLGTMLCESLPGYLPSDNNIACEYICGGLTDPENGVVVTEDGTRQGDVAVYTCDTTYKNKGTVTRTCLQDFAWDGASPTCEPAEIGDDCSKYIYLCSNITNGQCQEFSTCQCSPGYEDDGTGLTCSDIDECRSNPCQNGATCVDGANMYACYYSAGNSFKCEIPSTDDCYCSTQSVVIGAVLGLIILVLLAYAGYTTITIIRGDLIYALFLLNQYLNISSAMSANMTQRNEQNPGEVGQGQGHMTETTELSSALNQGNQNREGSKVATHHNDTIAQTYVNEPLSAEISADWKLGNKQNPGRAREDNGRISKSYINTPFSAGESAVLNQRVVHNIKRKERCEVYPNQIYINEPIMIGHENEQILDRGKNISDMEYFTLGERSRDNSTYNTLGANS